VIRNGVVVVVVVSGQDGKEIAEADDYLIW
jgi:hypothetical protein